MNHWELINKQDLNLDLKFRKVSVWDFKTPDGQVHSFEINRVGAVVCVCAIDMQGNLILVEQFRPGPQKVMLELVAGLVDPNEQPQEAAERELLEETGYKGDMELVGKVFPDAYSDVVRYVYLARNCIKVKDPQLDTSEFLVPKLSSVQSYQQYLYHGGYSTNIAAFYLALSRLINNS